MLGGVFDERGFDGHSARMQHKRFMDSDPELVWLSPPDFTGSLKVGHVVAAIDLQDHMRRVKEWGNTVYSYWHRAQL